MTDIAHAYYDLKVACKLVEDTGSVFQEFFSDLMEARHGESFTRGRSLPAGRHGDWKCDGFLRTDRSLFQVHAPGEWKSDKAVAKVDRDFAGALEHWDGRFDRWVFVHNCRLGLPPAVLHKLRQLDDANEVAVIEWGPTQVRQLVSGTSETRLADLYGPIPSEIQSLRDRARFVVPPDTPIGSLPTLAAHGFVYNFYESVDDLAGDVQQGTLVAYGRSANSPEAASANLSDQFSVSARRLWLEHQAPKYRDLERLAIATGASRTAIVTVRRDHAELGPPGYEHVLVMFRDHRENRWTIWTSYPEFWGDSPNAQQTVRSPLEQLGFSPLLACGIPKEERERRLKIL